HLFTFVGSLTVLMVAGEQLYDGFARPRPYDVAPAGRWGGFSLPSPPVGVLTTIVVAIVYSLVVAGRPRTIAKAVAAVVLAAFVAARLYRGIDHPFDALLALALGVGITLNAFRFFTPNDIFPVVYRAGKTAHLDVR